MAQHRFCCTVTGSREAVESAATKLAAAAVANPLLDGAGSQAEGNGEHCLLWHFFAESRASAEALVGDILSVTVPWMVVPVGTPRTQRVPPRLAGTSGTKGRPKRS